MFLFVFEETSTDRETLYEGVVKDSDYDMRDFSLENTEMQVINLIESRKEVFFVTADTTVHEAARYLREKQVRAVGVRDRPHPCRPPRAHR